MENQTSPGEQERIEALYALIRDLYRGGQAEEIVESFRGVFASHASSEERLNICEHWIEYYSLKRYQRLRKRRRPTYDERVTACSACGYPISHRHHLWDIQMHGENKVTVQLCSNCHELHHLIYNTLVRDSEYSRKLVLHVLLSGKVPPEAVQRLVGWCRATMKYEAEKGWLEPYKTTDAWVEEKLRW